MRLRKILAQEGLVIAPIPSKAKVEAELRRAFDGKAADQYTKFEVASVQIISDYGVDVIIALKHRKGDKWSRSSFSDFELVPKVREMLLDFCRAHDWAAGLSRQYERKGVYATSWMNPKAPLRESGIAAFSARIINPILVERNFHPVME